jgi:hypothetical protein
MEQENKEVSGDEESDMDEAEVGEDGELATNGVEGE